MILYEMIKNLRMVDEGERMRRVFGQQRQSGERIVDMKREERERIGWDVEGVEVLVLGILDGKLRAVEDCGERRGGGRRRNIH